MKRADCEMWPAIGRTPDARSDPQLSAHLEDCADCWAALDQVKRAAAALRALPHQLPDADRREQARTRLMAAIGGLPPARPAPPRLWLRGAAVVAASLCGATVLAAVGTHLWQQERPAVISAPAAPVRKTAPRPRRTVATAPSPAEIQGPPAPVLAPVVSPPPRAHASPPPKAAPTATEPPALVPAAVEPPALLPAAPAPPPAPAATPEERAFSQGWEALRLGEHRRAAAYMGEALALGPRGALAEDARYWRAVALGRAGASDEARVAMEEFLRRHGGSPRAGEVSAMLGWLLFDAGDRAGARALFHAAERDANAGVRQSARAGLQAAGAEPP
jgi:TolA-binding protein